MKREQIKQLAKLFDVEEKYGKLQQALTHKSFYDKKNEDKANSRYIFLGMFAFKGKLAEILNQYVPATGTQLQHFLGNLFKNKYLEYVFDKFKLTEVIRYGNNFDVAKHKHIFAFALLGFIIENCNEKTIKNFIFSNFLLGKEHLLPSNFDKGNIIAQCNYFAKLLYNKKIGIEINNEENGNYTVNVYAGSHLISSAESKSYKYARKKAINLALKIMGNTVAQKYFKTETYKKNKQEQEKLQQNENEANRLIKIQKHKQKVAIKKAENEKRRKQRKIEAQEKDKQRREAKKRAKIRQQAKQEADEKEKRKLANMSVAKIRHLQDKKK